MLHISNGRPAAIYVLACHLAYIFGLVTVDSAYYLVACYRRHGFTVKRTKFWAKEKWREKAEVSARRQIFVRNQVSLGWWLTEQSIPFFLILTGYCQMIAIFSIRNQCKFIKETEKANWIINFIFLQREGWVPST